MRIPSSVEELAIAAGRLQSNPTLEHYWIAFTGDPDVKMCARCEEPYPTDKPCTDAPLPVAVSAEQIVASLALLGGMTTEEARAGLAAFVKGLMKQ